MFKGAGKAVAMILSETKNINRFLLNKGYVYTTQMIVASEMMNETHINVTIHPSLSKIILVNAYCFSVITNSTPFHFQKCVI